MTTKENVDICKVIQVGITLMNEKGVPRPGVCTWSFNFKFDLQKDINAPDSVDLLKKAGLNFEQHKRKGIAPAAFGDLLITSGLVLSKKVKWICFHGAYDFAYILKILTGQPKLPPNEKLFFDILSIYFPNIIDIKFLMTQHKDLKKGGSLQKLAVEELRLRRIGNEHTAGS
eukprot:UN27953